MDRLRAFEVFAAVVAEGSFTRAADTLDTSPANVTRYIKELEEALGTRLLSRSSRRLSLTESGREFYERVARFWRTSPRPRRPSPPTRRSRVDD